MYAAKRERAAAVSIQKYVRKWLLRRAYLKLLSAAIFMQSNIHGFLTRKRFLQEKNQRAATLIQVNFPSVELCLRFSNIVMVMLCIFVY